MKAIIFDFDGTILDTEYAELAAWQFIYSEHNLIFPLEEWYKRVGTNPKNFDPISYLENLIEGTLDREYTIKRRREQLTKLVADLQPLPGIEALAVEDSPNGASAALAVGLQCVIVPNQVTMNLNFPQTFCTVNNLSELPLTQLLITATKP